jgi:hypothetical protein
LKVLSGEHRCSAVVNKVFKGLSTLHGAQNDLSVASASQKGRRRLAKSPYQLTPALGLPKVEITEKGKPKWRDSVQNYAMMISTLTTMIIRLRYTTLLHYIR